MNDDGISDLLLGAETTALNGISYVIFGSRSNFPAKFDLTTLNGGNGFSIPGITRAGYLGSSVSTAGDVNGDKIADLVLGAPSNSKPGISYVLFGSHGEFPAVFDLTTLNGSNGFAIPGISSGGELGDSVNTAGDINGDGISDLVLGAPFSDSYTDFTDSYTGASYVIFGKNTSISPTPQTPASMVGGIIGGCVAAGIAACLGIYGIFKCSRNRESYPPLLEINNEETIQHHSVFSAQK